MSYRGKLMVSLVTAEDMNSNNNENILPTRTLDLVNIHVVFEGRWTVHQEEALLKIVESFYTTATQIKNSWKYQQRLLTRSYEW